MKIIFGKKLYSFDKNGTTGNAVAFNDKKIVKIGTKEELVAEFPEAEVIDKYADNYIYPSWIEPHAHVVGPATVLGVFDYIDMLDWEVGDKLYEKAITADGFYEKIEMFVKEHPENEMYFIYGLTPMAIGELDIERTKKITDKPICVITSSTHAWFALNGMEEILNLDKQPDSPFIEKDENGNRTGRYCEQAMHPAMATFTKWMNEDPSILVKGIERAGHFIKKYGISSSTEHALGFMNIDLENTMTNDQFIKKTLSNKHRLVSLPWLQNWIGFYGSIENAYEKMEEYEKTYPKGESNYFFDKWIKIHLDGAIKDEEVKLSVNFNHKDNSGEWNYTRMETILDDVKFFWDKGYSISFHVQGDGAHDKFMEIYDYVTKDTPKGDKKFRLEHLGFAPQRFFDWLESKSDDDKIDVSGYSLYSHLYPEAFESTDHIPKDIRENLGRFKSVLNAGGHLSLHTDLPNAPTNPLFTAWAAVTKETIYGNVFNPEERLTREEALKAITLDAAIMTKIDKMTGSLETGKMADINILPFDLFECNLEEWKEMPSIQTYFEGEETK